MFPETRWNGLLSGTVPTTYTLLTVYGTCMDPHLPHYSLRHYSWCMSAVASCHSGHSGRPSNTQGEQKSIFLKMCSAEADIRSHSTRGLFSFSDLSFHFSCHFSGDLSRVALWFESSSLDFFFFFIPALSVILPGRPTSDGRETETFSLSVVLILFFVWMIAKS